MQNQTQGQNNNKARSGGSPASTSNMTSNKSEASGRSDSDSQTSTKEPMKSIGAVIGENLAKDTAARVDQAMETVSGYVENVKGYVTENPKESAAILVSFGFAAWALLYTKPGRQLFDKGAALIVPQVSKWAAENFSVADSQKHH